MSYEKQISKFTNQSAENGQSYKRKLDEISDNNKLSPLGKSEQAETMLRDHQAKQKELVQNAQTELKGMHSNLKDRAYGFDGQTSENMSFDKAKMDFSGMKDNELAQQVPYISSESTARAVLAVAHQKGQGKTIDAIKAKFDGLAETMTDLQEFEQNHIDGKGQYYFDRMHSRVPTKHSRTERKDLQF